MIEPRDILTKIELERLIRCARQCRDQMMEQKLQMQERELSYGDGYAREAILLYENDAFLLTSAIGKLWHMLLPHTPPPKPK